MEVGVVLGGPSVSAEHVRFPEDWRQKERHLDQARHDLRDITKPGADHTEEETEPDGVERDKRYPDRQLEQMPTGRRSHRHVNDHRDHEIMRDDDQIAPDDADNVYGERQSQISDVALRGDEHLTGVLS